MVLLRRAFGREPVGPLPAELLAEHRAQRLHPVVAGRRPERPAGGALLVGVVDDEDVGVGLLVLLRGDRPWRRSSPKRRGSTPSMSTVGSPSVIHSASCQPAPPAAVMPKLWPSLSQKFRKTPGRADDRAAVGGVADGAVVDPLDARPRRTPAPG